MLAPYYIAAQNLVAFNQYLADCGSDERIEGAEYISNLSVSDEAKKMLSRAVAGVSAFRAGKEDGYSMNDEELSDALGKYF